MIVLWIYSDYVVLQRMISFTTLEIRKKLPQINLYKLRLLGLLLGLGRIGQQLMGMSPSKDPMQKQWIWMFTYIQDFIPNNIIREVFLTMVLLFCKTSIHHISLTNMEYLSYFKNHVNIIIFGSKMLWFTIIIAIVYLLKNFPLMQGLNIIFLVIQRTLQRRALWLEIFDFNF